ncbi:MAG: hypothetical protein OEV79_12475 [candidate division WOR-3 bacterium]|nr:hypothetical protein [candidate division WOR-3 bacterium]
MLARVFCELKHHAPFTALGTLSGIAVMFVFTYARMPRSLSNGLFWSLHPGHVLLSAFVTTALYRRSTRAGFLLNFVVGYVGSVGIASLSDSLIPFTGELLLGLPYRGIHLGFVEKWWLVNPLVIIGITAGYLWPKTYLPHAGHVFLSTWASLFHMTMALGDSVTPLQLVVIPVFLFLAVWLPCCTSDIVFPLLFVTRRSPEDRM